MNADHDFEDDESGTTASELRPGKPSLSFFAFWNTLVFQPRQFFERYFEKGRSPYLFLVLMTVGINGAMDRLDRKFLQWDLKGRLAEINAVNNWPYYWGISVVGGLLGGAFYYYLGGWWYDKRVGWSGGQRDAESSRFLSLYSAFIPSFLAMLIVIGDTFSRARPYPDDDEGWIALTKSLIIVSATVYAVYVSYRGVRTVMQAPRWGARIWFLILPLVVYSLALGVVALVLTAAGVAQRFPING
jgi:hypothetical protein